MANPRTEVNIASAQRTIFSRQNSRLRLSFTDGTETALSRRKGADDSLVTAHRASHFVDLDLFVLAHIQFAANAHK